MDFLDIEGASGVTYRFRLWPEGAGHAPAAGNFVVVRESGFSVEVVVIGRARDLSKARWWTKARGEERLWTRLNVSHATRESEQDDLAARYPGARMVMETD